MMETSEVPYVNSEEHGFAATCNLGASYGQASEILFLNSDILIEDPNWLIILESELTHPEVGVVGPKLLYFLSTEKEHWNIRPPGKIQHAGVAFDFLNRPYHMFQGWHPEHPKVNRRMKVNAVTGACLLTKRELFEKLGGFSTAYTIGNFEDIEYCLRVRASGHSIIYTPDTFLYHYAGGSSNIETASFNEILFHQRCKEMLVYDEYRYYFGNGLK